MNSLTGIPRSTWTFLNACSDNRGFCAAGAAGPVWPARVAPSSQIVSNPAEHNAHPLDTLIRSSYRPADHRVECHVVLNSCGNLYLVPASPRKRSEGRACPPEEFIRHFGRMHPGRRLDMIDRSG